MEKIIPSVGVLIFRNDEEILLVNHGASASHLTGTYGLPAGKLEPGETEVMAAVREFHEETGLITNPEDLIELPKTYSAKIQRKDGSKIFSIKVFLCKSFSGELVNSDESRPEWVRISSLNNHYLLPNVEKIINNGREFK